MREVTADWEKQFRALRVTVPPYLWLFGEEAEHEREEEEERKLVEGEAVEQSNQKKLTSAEIDISLTFNNQEWIKALTFKYHDVAVKRLAYVNNFGEGMEEEEKNAKWIAEEPEEQLPDDLPEEEVKKREDEAAKKAAEETEESMTVPKRKGTKMYLHGENLLKTKVL